jgi:thymidylate kinase
MYVVIEGTDYTGKSTLASKLTEYFKSQGQDVLQTFEPRQPQIREIVKTGAMPWSSSYLFMADHLHNQLELVVPHLAKPNSMVIQDRHARISQAAYQLAQTNRLDPLIINNPDFAALPQVDLVLFLDVSIDEIVRRKDAEAQKLRDTSVANDVYDSYNLKRMQYLQNAYRSIMRSKYIDSVAKTVTCIEWSKGDSELDILNYALSAIGH